MRQSVEYEITEEGSAGEKDILTKLRNVWKNTVVRQGLCARIGCQVAQQFVGINSVMYYAPTIIQLDGFASNKTALALSLITSGLNALGTIVSMYFVDRAGWRRLLLISLVGIILCLGLLTGVFAGASKNSPNVGSFETSSFGNNMTCPNNKMNPSARWTCVKCLKASAHCGFCAHSGNKLLDGACLVSDPNSKSACSEGHSEWYTQGCPINFGWLAIMELALYIISYAPGMGTAPWIVNSELYPLRYRGLCGGIAAVSNWVSNLIVTQSFLTITKAIGAAYTFLLFGMVSCVAIVFVFFYVPETKGLPFEEVEKMLGKGDMRAGNKSDSKQNATAS